MELFKGHLDHEDLDLLVTMDGSQVTAAVRPGRDERWVRWGPPVELHAEPLWDQIPTQDEPDPNDDRWVR
jgi:hypothetical protein